MNDVGPADGSGPGAYSLLQQQLVEVRGRLDRQVARLIRLNQVSDDLLANAPACSVAASYAEVVVDVLDLSASVVWLLDDRLADQDRTASFGIRNSIADRVDLGERLAARLLERDLHRAVPLEEVDATCARDLDLRDALVCVAVGRSGEAVGVLLAANTALTAGMAQPDGAEAREILTLLADKLAVLLDSAAARRTIEEQVELLQDSEERLGQVLQGTNDGWWDWRFDRDECFVSPRWLSMLGLPANEGRILDRFWSDRIHPSDRQRFDEQLARLLTGSGRGLELEIRLRHADGTHLPVLVRGSVLRDDDGEPRRFAGSVLDLTERHRQERQVRRLAFFDTLTDLPNRRLLVDRLAHVLSSVDADGPVPAVLMLDLDRFKTLNDTHGHAAGDELLKEAAARLRAATRSSDTVARLSGDEFVVLLANAGPDVDAATEAARRVADKILSSMREPYDIGAGRIHHTASIGIALVDRPGLTVDTVLKRADVAMYAAKEAGRNSVSVFESTMEDSVSARSSLDARIRAGFADGEVSLVYQPQVDRNGTVVGAEALVRWTSADGPVSPSEFIPVAEESGFIHELGSWVLEAACEEIADDLGALPAGFRVAVNLAAPEFLHPGVVDRVLGVLERTGVPGSALRLEITEATVVHDVDFAVERMQALRSHGVEFSIDDFGTGFSSLTYLRRMPIDELKIDRSYVRHLLEEPADRAIVQAILTMCGALGVRVVAEGVETIEEFRALDGMGCDTFQGFLIARPGPVGAGLGSLAVAQDWLRQRSST